MGMEHEIDLDPGGRWMRVTTHGQASVGGFKRFVDEVLSRADWRPGLDLLCDHRQLDFRPLSSEQVRIIAEASAAYDRAVGGGRLAIVSSSEVGFGIVRMWEQLTDPDLEVSVRVFTSIEAAEPWLVEGQQGRA